MRYEEEARALEDRMRQVWPARSDALPTARDADELWAPFRGLVDPWWDTIASARTGDLDACARVVAFLWHRPRFFGSGYLAEAGFRALATGPDAGVLRAPIEDIVVRDLGRRTPTREDRYVRRVAARYWSPELVRRLGRSRSTGPQAERVLEIRRTYQRLGLVAPDTRDGA